jgi:hypothetical protein
MSRPLVLDEEGRARIAEVRAYAEANVEPLHAMVRRMGRADQAPGVRNREKTTVVIPFGYQCCFTLEQQSAGNCRHLSVSVPDPGRAPSPAAMLLLMEEFGFTAKSLEDVHVWAEGLAKKGHQAINVLELIK